MNAYSPTVDRTRTIGPWGTAARALAGAAGMFWALAVPQDQPVSNLPGARSGVVGLVVGLVAVPALLTLVMLVRGRNAPRMRLGHGSACLVTLVAVGIAQYYPVAVLVTISAPLLLLAAVGRAGCELLAIPNLALGRNDYLFCLPFSPIDDWERRRTGRTERSC